MIKKMKAEILAERTKNLKVEDNGYMVLFCKNKADIDRMGFCETICNYFQIKKA